MIGPRPLQIANLGPDVGPSLADAGPGARGARLGRLADGATRRAVVRPDLVRDGRDRPPAGASTVIGVLIARPAIQMILGHEAAVLPRWIARRRVGVDRLARVIG